jgi:hypothetical protein
MHTPDEQAWARDDLLTEITIENVADVRSVRYVAAVTFAVCHPDIPEGIPLGAIYVSGSPRFIWQKLAKDVPEILSDLEIGVSVAWGAPLSPDRDGSSIFGKGLVVEDVVQDRPVK